MKLAPSILASALDAQVDAILDRLARRALQRPGQTSSRVFDRETLGQLVRCSVAAEAIDRALGKTIVQCEGYGRTVGSEGYATVVARTVRHANEAACWPDLLHADRPMPETNGSLFVFATFAGLDDPDLTAVRAQAWCKKVTSSPKGTVVAELDGEALASQVQVVGELAPTLADAEHSSLAPALGAVVLPAKDETHTVILLNFSDDTTLGVINDWLQAQGSHRGVVSVEDPSLPRDWYVTNGKGLEAEVAFGAFSRLRLREFISFLQRIPWHEHVYDRIQLGILGERAEGVELHLIGPLDFDRRTLQSYGNLAALDREFGPIENPLIVIQYLPAEALVSPLATILRWLQQIDPVNELRRLDVADLGTLGLFDDRKARQVYMVPGKFDQAWCWDFCEFLNSVPWSPDGQHVSVTLHARSANGWRSNTWVDTSSRNRGRSVSGTWALNQWNFDSMRTFLATTFAGANRRMPLLEDLSRFDERCLQYMDERGYDLIAERMP